MKRKKIVFKQVDISSRNRHRMCEHLAHSSMCLKGQHRDRDIHRHIGPKEGTETAHIMVGWKEETNY